MFNIQDWTRYRTVCVTIMDGVYQDVIIKLGSWEFQNTDVTRIE